MSHVARVLALLLILAVPAAAQALGKPGGTLRLGRMDTIVPELAEKWSAPGRLAGRVARA